MDLPRDIAMPMREVEQAATILKKNALLQEKDGFFFLTEKGKETAHHLFDLADSHQNEVLNQYPKEEQDIFIKILQNIAGVQ